MKVNEIFFSIQGESTYAGLPCVFIRLTGCNLRCSYCDTQYAYEEGTELSIEEILKIISHHNCNLAEITGGEPLLQKETPELAMRLMDIGKTVLIETNGSADIDLVPAPIVRILDIKCPGSKETHKMNWDNLNKIENTDNIKFVMQDRNDFEWAINIVQKYKLINKLPVLFSPSFGKIEPKILAAWILETGLPIRLQIQSHKYIWHENMRGV